MKRSAWRRIRRNCHHLRKMRYQETMENTTRMASTNLVSRLDVRTSSQGVVGTARPTWKSTVSALPERLQGPSQAVPDGDQRAPPERLRRLVHRQRVAPQLAGALRCVPNLHPAPTDGDERGGEVVDRRLDAGADVESAPVHPVRRRERDLTRGEIGCHHVLDEHHVPRLTAGWRFGTQRSAPASCGATRWRWTRRRRRSGGARGSPSGTACDGPCNRSGRADSVLFQVGRAVPTTPWELVLTSSRETKFVLAILVVFSIVSWYLIFLKWWQFRRMRRQADRFMAEIERATRLDDAYHAAMRLPAS